MNCTELEIIYNIDYDLFLLVLSYIRIYKQQKLVMDQLSRLMSIEIDILKIEPVWIYEEFYYNVLLPDYFESCKFTENTFEIEDFEEIVIQ